MKATQAQKVLDADLANILRKVKAGKPLTARERVIVEGSAETQSKPLTWKALAAELGVSPVTLWDWRKDKAAPTSRKLEEWKQYQHNRQTLGNGSGKFTAEEIADLKGSLLSEKTKREKAERRLKELQLEREEKGWVPYEEAEAAVCRVLEPLSSLLENCPKAYAHRMNPNEPEHAEEMLREMVDDFKKQIAATRGANISKKKGRK